MSEAAQHAQYTFADYVALEAGSNVRHEFLGGQMYAIAGGTPEHAALAAAVSGFLFGQLQGKPCRVYSSDLRVGVPATEVLGGQRVELRSIGCSLDVDGIYAGKPAAVGGGARLRRRRSGPTLAAGLQVARIAPRWAC